MLGLLWLLNVQMSENNWAGKHYLYQSLLTGELTEGVNMHQAALNESKRRRETREGLICDSNQDSAYLIGVDVCHQPSNALFNLQHNWYCLQDVNIPRLIMTVLAIDIL